MNADRVRLSILLRRAAPDIVRALVDEAARSTSVDSAVAAESSALYVSAIDRSLPRALDAIAADDALRAQLLASLAESIPADAVHPIPSLVRVGLTSIGLHLARDHVLRATAGEPGAGDVVKEFDLYAAAVKDAIALYLRS